MTLNDIVKIEVEREFNIRDRLRKVLLKSIEIKPEDRYQSTDEILSKLKGKGEVPEEHPGEEEDSLTKGTGKEILSEKRWKFEWLGVIIVILAVFIGGLIAGRQMVGGHKEVVLKSRKEKGNQVVESKAKISSSSRETVSKQETEEKTESKPVVRVVREWDKTFGGSYLDVAYSIIQTRDGGYVVAGGTDSKGNGYADVWVIKLKEEVQR
jgi:hypothetical protein